MTIGDELKKRINTYKKNKTAVSPEDLNGKYKKAFENLKEDLRQMTDSYLHEVIFQGLPEKVHPDVYKQIQDDIDRQNVGRKAGRAVFIYFDFDELARIAGEEKQRVRRIYERGKDEKT